MPTMRLNKMAFIQGAMEALRELDKATAFHFQWLHELHSSVICGEPIQPDVLEEDAHRRCDFGRWYYGEGVAHLAEESAFESVGELHKTMHDTARAMLRSHLNGQGISPRAYRDFVDTSTAFKADLGRFKHEIITRVCTVDHLTGAWNRHAMALRLVEEAARMQRTGQHCCLSLMDLDHFKQVNDEFGHLAGDAVLQAIVRLLNTYLRQYDSVFRYGGEEFLICLPNTGLEAVAALLNRLREQIAEHEFELDPRHPVRLTASFGVAELISGEPVESTLNRVDHALLAAKAGGRNQVCVWDINS